MIRLVVEPLPSQVRYALFHGEPPRMQKRGRIPAYTSAKDGRSSQGGLLLDVLGSEGKEMEEIGLIVLHGGNEFDGPALLDEASLEKLHAVIAQAPMHLPRVIALCSDLRRKFPKARIHLFFQTAFFQRLPERERTYAIPRRSGGLPRVERNGYLGLYHQFASDWATAHLRREGLKEQPFRLISFCLDRHLEMAAVRGGAPLVVTSGATPLEGFPGQTTCGEIDPGLILQMARVLDAGPEELNRILTHESGFYGLVGRKGSLADIFSGEEPETICAREILLHRMLLATGAALAAMGGVDAFVFSGIHYGQGHVIGNWLLRQMPFLERNGASPRLLFFPEGCESGVIRHMQSRNTSIRPLSSNCNREFRPMAGPVNHMHVESSSRQSG